MNQELLEILMRSSPAEARQRLNLAARDLDAQVLQLAARLNGDGDSLEGKTVIAYTTDRSYEAAAEANGTAGPLNFTPELQELRDWVCRFYRAQQQKYLTPELLEWARQSINEEEILAALREIQTTGGWELKDFIHELEQEVNSRE